jgi:gliding motility-associated-like protein
MSQKLQITSMLLLTDHLNEQSEKRHFFKPLAITKQALLLMLFSFISLTGYGQLATETFQNGIPATWAQARVNGTAQWTTDTDGYQSTRAAFIDPSNDDIGAGKSAQYFLITPLITVPANGEIRFFTKQLYDEDNGNNYQIRLSTASQPDVSGFTTTLTSWTETQLNPNTPVGYVEKVVAIPPGIAPGINVYIAFVLVTNQVEDYPLADTWFIDNVSVQTAPACSPILGGSFMANAITTNSATLNWLQPSASNFEVQVVPAGTTPGTTGTATATNSYNATGLTPDIFYDVYVRSVCGTNLNSTWSGPFTFKTLIVGTSCAVPIVIPATNTPYVYTSNLDLFQNPSLTYTTQGSCLSQSNNYLNGDKAFFSYTPTQNGVINIKQLALPFTQGSGCFGNAETSVIVYDNCDAVGVTCLAALNTTEADVPRYISNLNVIAGHTYTIVVSSVFGSGTSICFTFELNFSTCPSPDVYTYKNLAQTGASFSWNNAANLASAWEYIVLPANAPAPTAGTAGTATTTNNNNAVTGLTAGTKYNLYVRSLCNGTPGGWGIPYAFTTQCETFPLPYVTGFAAAAMGEAEPCWSSLDVNNDGETWGYLGGFEVVQGYATLSTQTNQNNNNDYLISPQVNFPPGSSFKKLRYKHQITGWDEANTSSYSIMLSTTGIGVENFTYVIRPTTAITNTDWQEVTYDIPASITGNVNIAWIVEPDAGQTQNSNRLNISDVYIYENCDAPSAPQVGAITETTAELKWTPAASTDSQWEVLILPINSAAPLMTTPGTLVDTNNYLAPNLTPATHYEYYVRTSCSATAKSDWIGPVSFTTLCGAQPEPYFETFNTAQTEVNYPPTKRFCWEILNQNADTHTWNFTATAASTNVRTTGNDEWLISPAIALDAAAGSHELKFKHKKTGGGTNTYGFEVLISYTDKNPSSFTPLIGYQNYGANTAYQNVIKNFKGTGTIYIAFRIPPQFVPAQNFSVQIDDFSIQAAASCVAPTNVVRNATDNSFTWTPGVDETQWEVVIATTDVFVPTNGTIVNTPSYTATGLQPGTTYNFFVRAICSENNVSKWSAPLQFTTPCTQVFTTPFIETFEADSQSLNCWSPNAWVLNNALNPYAGNYTAAIYTYYPVPNQHWLISPTVTVKDNQRLRYFYKASQWEGYEEDLKVWLSTTGPAISGFTTLLFDTGLNRIINNEVYKEMIINLPEGVTGNINIGFQIPAKVAGQIYDRQTMFIDNVIIEDIPSCPLPYNIETASISDTNFEVRWNSDSSITKWEILVVPFGTANPFENINPDNIYVVTSNPATITGLNPATAYQVYIRPVCSNTVNGDWSEVGQVVTRCSLEDLCEYTITLHSGDGQTGGVAGPINVIQNGVIIQSLTFPSAGWSEVVVPIDYTLFLCNGVEFSLHWASVGWVPNEFPEAYVKITNSNGEEVWMSELGIGVPKTDIYKGLSLCGPISCPQPKDLKVSETGVLSWTPGGSETKWEVYVQPYQLGALPQSGTAVATNSYTLQNTDFIKSNVNAYEYFVRAICEDGSSNWSGPIAFIRNDAASKATVAPVNAGEDCNVALEGLSFLGSTPSSEAMACAVENNGGDVWAEFTATSTTHHIELGAFSGTHFDAGFPQLPKVVMTLYKVNADESLQEIACSDNNVLRTMYSSEVVVGERYKVRLTNTNTEPNQYIFNMCITTITDPCRVNAPNYSFEKPGLVTGVLVGNMIYDNVIPGWRSNMTYSNTLFFWNAQNDFSLPYHGGQFIQMATDYSESGDPAEVMHDPNDLVNIRGEYQDFDSSEITQFDYSFAHRKRAARNDVSGTRIVQLFAGPIGGPYTLVTEEASAEANWTVAVGKYNVPAGQKKTRFIFRTKNNFGQIVLDAANFIPFNEILTAPHGIECENPETELKAEGIGTWIAEESNPARVIFSNANDKNTNVSGFNTPGEYTFRWKTRYCEDSVTVTYTGIKDVPTVTSPVEYCLNATAEPLAATPSSAYTFMWYTEEVGGTGTTTAPTPVTTAEGTTSYYVAFVNAAGCEGPRTEVKVVVNPTIQAATTFNYNAALFCASGSNPVIDVAEGFTTGGTFTATPDGLTIDPATGAINLATSKLGVYRITYTVDAGCTSGSSFIDITISDAIVPVVAFTFEGSYCNGTTTAKPKLPTDFTEGGVFTATGGLSINATTGEVNFAASAPGSYTVTYTIAKDAATCNSGGTNSVTFNLSGNLETIITQDCKEQLLWLHAGAKDGEADGAVTYTWKNENGATLATDTTDFNVSEYYANNPNLTLPLVFRVTTGSGECTTETEYTVNSILCLIPRGISPNGDGDNDSFDLSSMGVKEITIFNRYGLELYHFKGAYTNQWHGQDKSNNDIPDGTYFYSIHKTEGGAVTGWVYINREQ